MIIIGGQAQEIGRGIFSRYITKYSLAKSLNRNEILNLKKLKTPNLYNAIENTPIMIGFACAIITTVVSPYIFNLLLIYFHRLPIINLSSNPRPLLFGIVLFFWSLWVISIILIGFFYLVLPSKYKIFMQANLVKDGYYFEVFSFVRFLFLSTIFVSLISVFISAVLFY